MSAFGRPMILGLFAGASACALVLDLPSPALDRGALDGSMLDGAIAGDGAAADGTAPFDGSGDAPVNCDLTLAANCGACGVDCSTGICTNGVCTLVDHTAPGGLYAPAGIAVVGSELFVTVQGSPVQVGRCPASGCAAVGLSPLFASDASSYQGPESVVANVTEGAVYWTSYELSASGGVYRTPMDGGPTLQLNGAQGTDYASSLAVTEATVVWVSDQSPGGVFSCPTTGCPSGIPVQFGGTSAYGKSVIAAPDGRIIFAAAGAIRWCPGVACADGGNAVAVSQGLSLGQLVLAPDGDTLYWVRNFPDTAIMRASMADAAVPARVAPEREVPSAMLMVGDQLFWTLQGTNPNDAGANFPLASTVDGMVRKCRLPACLPVVDVARNEAAPVALGTDGKAIYWVNGGVARNVGGRGAVKKAPL